MATILGICGSLRHGSYNGMLLRAVAGMMPAGSTLELASIRDIPLYDGDLETEHGLPSAVQELKERIVRADGLLLVTPEYNNSIPGVFKNAIDWLSRPASDIPRVFRGRPVAVMGATPGIGGTGLAQAAWLPVLRVLGAMTYSEARILIANAGKVFDAGGQIVDMGTADRVRAFAEGYAAFVGRQKSLTTSVSA